MIATDGASIAVLGGWRGDRLFRFDGRAVADFGDLGWDERRGVTPQRRILIAGADTLVLEPVEGPILVPPLRVRRFGPTGTETGREEGADESAAADLAFWRGEDGTLRRFGIDPGSGRPLFWEATLAFRFKNRPADVGGTPLRDATGPWGHPIRAEALVREHAGAVDSFFANAAPGSVIPAGGSVHAAAVSRGRPAVFAEGAWRRLKGAPLFDPRRPPMGRICAHWGDGAVLLRRDGGDLPVWRGPPAALGPGRYSDLLAIDGRVWAVAAGPPPALVEVTTSG
ncbi:MAG: hypothetical protein OER88_07655 [Planctomycetota bacterium]|nr:hypothetical protein [Planctomycetota bacterium]